MAQSALSGLRIVELGDFIAAPFCTKLLADLGADVIKVEKPLMGDWARQHGPFLGDIPDLETSGLFLNLNTNKLGVTLNLETATGRKILNDLLKQADVFVEDRPLRFVQEKGIGYDSLRETNPSLIVISITPFGRTGPYKDRNAYDISCTGFSAITCTVGYPDREPVVFPMSQGDYQAGICGAIATQLALFGRDKTGRGQSVDLAEVDCWATLHTGWGVQDFVSEGRVRQRTGHRAYRRPWPNCVLPCKDGYISLDTVQERQFRRLVEMIGSPAWALEERFKDREKVTEEYAEEADALFGEWLNVHTKEEIFALAREHRVPLAPVKTVDELVNDPHLQERQYFVDVSHPKAGTLKYPGAPYKLSRTPWEIRRPAPLLGEHNEAVLCGKLGYSRQDLAALRRAGVI